MASNATNWFEERHYKRLENNALRSPTGIASSPGAATAEAQPAS